MTKPIDQIGHNELTPTLKSLAKAGGTTEHADWIRSRGNAAKLIRFMDRERGLLAPDPGLIHGVFNKTTDVLAAFKARCTAKRIDFGKFSWVGSEQAPEFDTNDPETVVVLDATLESFGDTLNFAWAWALSNQKAECERFAVCTIKDREWRLLSDDRDCEAEGDGPEFKPWTLRWVRIKLDANVGVEVISVCDPQTSPGLALLYMCAEHPILFREIERGRRQGFWIPGLKLINPEAKSYKGEDADLGDDWIPYIGHNDSYGRLIDFGLHGIWSHWAGKTDTGHGHCLIKLIPAFR